MASAAFSVGCFLILSSNKSSRVLLVQSNCLIKGHGSRSDDSIAAIFGDTGYPGPSLNTTMNTSRKFTAKSSEILLRGEDFCTYPCWFRFVDGRVPHWPTGLLEIPRWGLVASWPAVGSYRVCRYRAW